MAGRNPARAATGSGLPPPDSTRPQILASPATATPGLNQLWKIRRRSIGDEYQRYVNVDIRSVIASILGMPAEAADLLPELARRLVRTTFGARATEPRPLATGAWSQAFELTVDDSEVVLRIGSHGTDFAKDEIAAHLAGPDLPVPPVLTRGMIDG